MSNDLRKKVEYFGCEGKVIKSIKLKNNYTIVIRFEGGSKLSLYTLEDCCAQGVFGAQPNKELDSLVGEKFQTVIWKEGPTFDEEDHDFRKYYDADKSLNTAFLEINTNRDSIVFPIYDENAGYYTGVYVGVEYDERKVT